MHFVIFAKRKSNKVTLALTNYLIISLLKRRKCSELLNLALRRTLHRSVVLLSPQQERVRMKR